MNDSNEQFFVKIAVLDSDIESQLVTSILTEQEIPHLLRSYHDTAYDGLFQMQKGWGEISAPLDYREDILEIISAVRNGAVDEK
ncbi:MAG: hypothetical protein ACOZF0_14785 [Thermodesulfobacteriota bacterium]